MTLQQNTSPFDKPYCFNEEDLEKLYKFLLPIVSRWVYFSYLSLWRGQEYDIIQDIIQETVVRLALYSQQFYVYFPERICLVIAKRYYLDLKRKDSRVDHIIAETFVDEQRQFWEIAFENVYYEELFTLRSEER